MKRFPGFLFNGLCMTGVVAAAMCLAAPLTFAQQNQKHSNGIVDDWSQHHVIFSNPGTVQDAARKGKGAEWERIVSSPRYQMQWFRRHASLFRSEAVPGAVSGGQEDDAAIPSFEGDRGLFRGKHGSGTSDSSTSGGKWTVSLGGASAGVSLDMYPAKYSFSPVGAPNCTSDYVVFPIDAAGASNQANLLGVNNLYSSCSSTWTNGTTPPTMFAYYVGTGTTQTSPVLSEDGTKIAFVESVSGGSNFHVLTIGTTGSNGTSFGAPAVPGTGNNAVDTRITMSGGVMDTRSSPFVDYTDDVAYVGDDTGRLHKFTGVFAGTPAETTGGGWPFAVASGVTLTGPTYDSVSLHIFVGGSDGNLYCIDVSSGTPTFCSMKSVAVGSGGTGGGILDAPIVDSTAGTVFAEANNFTLSCTSPTATGCAVLTQVTTAMAGQVNVNMGYAAPTSSTTYTDLYRGTFDNAYFTSGPAGGHMYFCGNQAGAATPTLYRIGFNSSGTLNSANDGSSYQLVASGDTGTGFDCTPMTEVYNAGQSRDYLFVGVKNGGIGSTSASGNPSCSYTTCIMGIDLASTFPTVTATTLTSSPGGGTSGMIIDNVSTATGASQIYFGNKSNSVGEQVSQAGLN